MPRFQQWKDLVLPAALIAGLLVVIVPLPPQMLDILLAANITAAILVLLTTVYVRTPLEFNIFPSLLLATTLSRLVLNVASTRLILTRGESDGLQAAGGVIHSFGEFVTGNSLTVGLILFAILVVIQFVVITKGASRVSEVAARFALDGMPGKQMAVDADLATGAIDSREAVRRREEITRQADFYGAMDGASKFVRGDAIAAIVITLTNIVGGFVVGVLLAGMSPAAAASIFTKLTIGDGLVSQIPALLISLAAALLVTRSTQSVDLPLELLRQLFARPRTLLVAGGFAAILTFTHLPKLPLMLIGGGCIAGAVWVHRQQQQQVCRQAEAKNARTSRPAEPRVEDYLAVDPVEMEIGVGLIRLADPKRGGDLLARIAGVRKSVALELGIVLPKVRIRDNLQLDDDQYVLKIHGTPVDSGTLEGEQAGPRTRQLANRLHDVVVRHAADLLTRDALRHLLDELRTRCPAAVDELIPEMMKLGEVQQVLQRLLREQVPIRQLAGILEALSDSVSQTRSPVELAEIVRQRLARTLSSRYCDRHGQIQVATLHPQWESMLIEVQQCDGVPLETPLAPKVVQQLAAGVGRESEPLAVAGRPRIVLTAPAARAALKRALEGYFPDLVVLSYREIVPDVRVESIGFVSAPPQPL